MGYSPSHATIDINEDNEKYINEIKQLKSEVEMYKQYIESCRKIIFENRSIFPNFD